MLGIIITLFIFVLGAVTLGVSVSFLINPSERKLGLIKPLSNATTFATILGFVSGLAVTFHFLSQSGEKMPGLVAGGVSESLIPAVIGFALLAISWCAVSMGMRKHI
jgi:hypothetical protein